MANTTNLNLVKLSGSEKMKTYPSNQSSNMDAIDGAFGAGFGVNGKPSVNAEINSLADGMAIIANGNTHAAITSGQFVYVRNHGSLSNGLYVASSNIAANATLSGNNLTADSSGGLNALNSNINAVNAKLEKSGFEYIPTTTAELKEALVDMINKAPRFGFAFFILRTSDMNNTDIFPKNNYGCIVERASTSLYGSILIFTYGQPSKIYKFSYSNGDVGYSFVHEFTGTQIANW